LFFIFTSSSSFIPFNPFEGSTLENAVKKFPYMYAKLKNPTKNENNHFSFLSPPSL